MSWVFAAVLLIFCVCAYIGWKKGIIRIVLSLATLVVTLFASVILTPVIGGALRSGTSLYDNLERSVYITLLENENNLFGGAVDDVVGDDAGELQDTGLVETINGYITQIGEMLHLPESVTNSISASVIRDKAESIAGTGAAHIKSIIMAVLAVRLANIIFNAIIYMIVFIIIYVVLKIIVALTNLVSRLPVIHQANKIGGFAVGIAEGLVIVWLLFVVITACGNMQWAADALADIGGNPVLAGLYDHNLIMKMAFKGL